MEAVARAEVRAGALPVLDDPREAGLRSDARIDRAAIWSAMMVTQPPCRSRFVAGFQRWRTAGQGRDDGGQYRPYASKCHYVDSNLTFRNRPVGDVSGID